MIKVLSIGNSFSQDATRYLQSLSLTTPVTIKSENLCIGGCSLKTHYKNIQEDAKNYYLETGGEVTGIPLTMKEGLLRDTWDYVTLQQASHYSFDYTTYQPYLNEVAAYVKEHCPTAKLVIHQTWAYEEGSQRLCEELHYAHANEMFRDIQKAYAQAAKDIDAYGIIPSGQLFMNLLESGIEKVHRDTYHAKLGLGRYALGLLWYKFFTNKSIDTIDFSQFDEPISHKEIEIIKNCVNQTL